MLAPEESDMESQFEEEHAEPPILSSTHGSEKWGRGKKLGVTVLVLVALALMIAVPLAVKNGGVSTGRLGDTSNQQGNFEDSNQVDMPKNDNDEKEPHLDITTVDTTTPEDEQDDQDQVEVSKTTEPETDSSVSSSQGSDPIRTQTICPANATANDVMEWIHIANDITGEESGDSSGWDTAINADGTIVATSSVQNGNGAGHVRVYRYSSSIGVFSKMGQDLDGQEGSDKFGFSIALDESGTRLAVGGVFNDEEHEESESGHVRVFDYQEDSDEWVQVGQEIEGKFDGTQAISMSADGSRLAVAASLPTGSSMNSNSTDTAHVRVYELVTNSWVQIGDDISGDSAAEKRSLAFSADGKRLAVGAYQFEASGSQGPPGQVQVYQYNSKSKSWHQVSDTIEGSVPYLWGSALSLSGNGNRIAIGSPVDHDGFLPLPGSTRVFELADSKWTQIGPDLKGGVSVALSRDGTRVIIGDHNIFSGGSNSGGVNVYVFEDNDWWHAGNEITGKADEAFGVSVAATADGNRVVVSAPAHTTPSGDDFVGVTRIYDMC